MLSTLHQSVFISCCSVSPDSLRSPVLSLRLPQLPHTTGPSWEDCTPRPRLMLRRSAGETRSKVLGENNDFNLAEIVVNEAEISCVFSFAQQWLIMRTMSSHIFLFFCLYFNMTYFVSPTLKKRIQTNRFNLTDSAGRIQFVVTTGDTQTSDILDYRYKIYNVSVNIHVLHQSGLLICIYNV